MIGKVIKNTKPIYIHYHQKSYENIGIFENQHNKIEKGNVFLVVGHTVDYDSRLEGRPSTDDWVLLFNNKFCALNYKIFRKFNEYFTIVEDNEKDVKTV